MLEEFDASRLEELAESLLADVITDLAEDVAPGSGGAAACQGAAKRLLERVVGTQPEQLESTEDRGNADGHLDAASVSIIDNHHHLQQQNQHSIITPNTTLFENQKLTDHNTIIPTIEEEDSETTLYGTYDEKTNCITIVMPDENIPLDEAVEEVQYCPSVVMSLISPIPDTYLDDISNVGHVSPAHSAFSSNVSLSDAKAPTLAESGYESLGSPASTGSSDLEPTMDFSDMWNDSFSELFPSLM